MRRFSFLVAASMLCAGIATPAFAHPEDRYGVYQSEHDADHDQIDLQHDDTHDYLDQVHREAHEDGLTPWEHEQLHRQFDREHKRAHRQLDREHDWQHRHHDFYDGWSNEYYGSNGEDYDWNRGNYGANAQAGVQFYFGF